MAATDHIGKPVPTQTVVLERGPVSNFAKAVKDESAVYADPRAASEAGFDAIPAPPTYAFAMHHWGLFPELQAAEPGTHPMMLALGELMSGGGLILHGEQEFTYHRPLTVGQQLTASGSITDIYSKEGKNSKAMTFIVTETVWSDDQGPVVTSTMTLLHR